MVLKPKNLNSDHCSLSIVNLPVHRLIAVGMLELVVEGLFQVVRDEPIAVRQKLIAVLWHFPARVIGSETVHHR